MDKKEISLILSNSPPFSKLGRWQLWSLINICEVKEYKNGETIYQEADDPDYFYLLLKGRVGVSTKVKGHEGGIEILKRGTCFGIISLLTDDPHSVTTRSIENSLILRVKKNEFKKFLKKNPLISLDISKILSQRVKARFKPKMIFQSKKIGIIDLSNKEQPDYLFGLAKELKKQTQKDIICIQIIFSLQASSKKNDNVLLNNNRAHNILKLENFSEETLLGYISNDEVDQLVVDAGCNDNFLSLLNFLSESYHFIVYNIPIDFIYKSSDEFILPADILHLLFISDFKQSRLAKELIIHIKKVDAIGEEKIKLIAVKDDKRDHHFLFDQKEIANKYIYATLPGCASAIYSNALRRIAREAGGVSLGVSLGSGAAYGFSHIGILRIFEREGIEIDAISGTSMGAVIGALWACGFKSSDIEKIAGGLGKKIGGLSALGLSIPFKGIIKAKHLENIFKSVFKDLTFQDLNHTFKIAAFSFFKRKTVILETGLVYKAVAASCAFPGIFEPVKLKQEIFLDGGILEPLPAEVLLNYGVHKIIACDITLSQTEALREYKKRKRFHVFDFIFGSIETMQYQFISQARKAADVVIHPNLEGLGWTEFGRIKEFVKRGEEAAEGKIEEINRLVKS